MANTLTGLIPTLYESLDVVSREMVGFIPAVSRDSSAARAAVNQTVRSPIAPEITLEDITPGADPADSGDQTISYADVVITKSKAAPVRWTGEEQVGMATGGTLGTVMRDQFANAMRALVNAIETDIGTAVKNAASRAYGTAGTTPFGTAGDLSDFAGILEILEKNGAPKTDLQFVGGSAAWANLRGKQSVLFKVNEAGSSDMLRNGMTDRVMGFALRNSAGVASHTKGTGTGFLLNSAATAVGTTSIPVDTGTGTIVAGDVVTFAGTSHKYVVGTALSGGTLVLNKPGLLIAETDNDALTVGNSYTANAAFARSALHLVTRAPAVPEGGDAADDAITITDPVTGLSFEVRAYRQYRRVKYEVCAAWGVAATKPEHISLLLG